MRLTAAHITQQKMEENDYRKMYSAVIPHRCLFEKGILSRHCACSRARRHNLAEREAVACESPPGRAQCETWLNLLRDKAIFALQIRESAGPLPHAKEIKVQAGGLRGVAVLVDEAATGPWLNGGRISDVCGLLNAASAQFCGLGNLPFDEIVRSVVHFRGREKRPVRR